MVCLPAARFPEARGRKFAYPIMLFDSIIYGGYGDFYPLFASLAAIGIVLGLASTCSTYVLMFGYAPRHDVLRPPARLRHRLSKNGVEHSWRSPYSEAGDFIEDGMFLHYQVVCTMNECGPEDDVNAYEHGQARARSNYVLSQFGPFSENGASFGRDLCAAKGFLDVEGLITSNTAMPMGNCFNPVPCNMEVKAVCFFGYMLDGLPLFEHSEALVHCKCDPSLLDGP